MHFYVSPKKEKICAFIKKLNTNEISCGQDISDHNLAVTTKLILNCKLIMSCILLHTTCTNNLRDRLPTINVKGRIIQEIGTHPVIENI